MIEALHDMIAAVCPIDGVSLDPLRIDFAADATAEQRAAAQAIMDAFDPDAPTADDVRAEAQRRIIALTGATTFDGCLVRQLNAQMRASELILKQASGETWTAEEQAEAAMLQALADGVKAIRAASNVMEPSPPADYADNSHWPS